MTGTAFVSLPSPAAVRAPVLWHHAADFTSSPIVTPALTQPSSEAVGATFAAAFGVAGAAALGRRSRRSAVVRHARAPAQLGKAPTGTITATMGGKAQNLKKEREEMVQKAQQRATPVPGSFDQAVNWAVMAAISGVENGKDRQNMLFAAGPGEADMNGFLGEVLAFAEAFCNTLAMSPSLEGATVKAVFSDTGACESARVRWNICDEEDGTLKLESMPPVMRNTAPTTMLQRQLDDLCSDDTAFIVIVAPRHQEIPAFLEIIATINANNSDICVIVLNSQFVEEMQMVAGDCLRRFKMLYQTFMHSFHLENVNPEADSGIENACVIARVWPRPYSIWEDCPEDPDAVGGYFLLDLNEERAPGRSDVDELLLFSQQARRKMMGIQAAEVSGY